VPPWLEWFLARLDRAFDGTESTLASVMMKARFWEKHNSVTFNGRQSGIINRLLNGFEGKLTTSKWAALAKAAGGGRSTSYSLIVA
jgi:Fic family protein